MTTEQKIISLLLRHPKFARTLICSDYAFTEAELEKYKEVIDWEYLSGNSSIKWTADLIKKYKNRLNLETLTNVSPAFADLSFLESVKEAIPWKGSNSGLFLSSSIARNKHIPWSKELIWKYRKELNFEHLSYNEKLPWSEKLLERFKSRWDWDAVAANPVVPWTLQLLDKYLDRIDLSSMYVMYNLCYSNQVDLIEAYHPYLNWKIICQNPNLPWMEENLMERWAEYLVWEGLAYNRKLHQNPGFFEDNLEIWMTKPTCFFHSFSRVPTIQWTDQLINRYCDLWDWEWLCQNEGVPWNEELIEKFKDKVWWGGKEIGEDNWIRSIGGLIMNENLSWSIDFLIRYEEQIDFDELWGCYIWDKAFKTHMDEKTVDTIFRLI